MAAVSSLVRKSRYQFANVNRLLQTQSSFKIVFILCFAAILEAGLFWLFFDGFDYLHRMGGIGLIIINKLFAIFFLGMGLMLVMSSVVTSFSTIYRSDEIPFLVTRPFTNSQIVLYKFFESSALSSWAFFFVIIPFVGAYALHEHLSPFFAFWNLLFSIPFLGVCSAIGTFVTMILVRWCPLGRSARILGIALAAIAAGFLVLEIRKYRSVVTESDLNLAMLLPGFSLASNPLLPSWWVADGIMALTRGQWIRGILLLGMITSTAMVACIAIEWFGNRLFYDGWQRLAGSSSNKDRAPLMLQSLNRTLSFMPHDIRAIVMKDIRTFLRDPVQWSQALIFFGLLALYFCNLRTFRYHTLPEGWRNTIAFLNVFSISAVICSLGSRFIYPQLSLEGQAFWILGLSPAKMSRILVTKFAIALSCMLSLSLVLMTLSSRMLEASPSITLVAVILACAISCAVCGLSTGLGAIFLDLTERNPAAIVSGFGGTLNLVLCLAFMLAAIFPFGLIFHLHLIHGTNSLQMHNHLALGSIWLLTLTTASVVIPLNLGLKSMLRREF